MKPRPWILLPLSNSWIIFIVWLHIAIHRSPNINCCWVGAVPNLDLKPSSKLYMDGWECLSRDGLCFGHQEISSADRPLSSDPEFFLKQFLQDSE